MKKYFLHFFMLNLLLLPLFAACSAAASPGEADLSSTTWVLSSYLDAQGQVVNALPDTEATMKFTTDQVSGSTGCNSYSAKYTANGEKIAISQAVSTLMACESPQGAMEQESAFLRALGNAATFNVSNGLLEIYDASGVLLLTFRAAS